VRFTEGNYLLLAPNSDINKLSVEEVFDASVGDIYVGELPLSKELEAS